MTIDQQLFALNEKLLLLVKQYQRLQKDNERLKQQVTQQQLKIQLQDEAMNELQQKLMVLKMAAGEMSEKDKKMFEKTLDNYIREIDKTIQFLGE